MSVVSSLQDNTDTLRKAISTENLFMSYDQVSSEFLACCSQT